MIVGSAAVDIIAQVQPGTDEATMKHSTIPGKVTMTPGGVARNIAEAAHRSMAAMSSTSVPLLVSAVCDDYLGRLLTEETARVGMRTDGLIITTEHSTPVCNMFLDSSGSLLCGVADMNGPKALDGEAVSCYYLHPWLHPIECSGHRSHPEASAQTCGIGC